MLIGVIADDYTGASDIANTLARGGLATIQFLGLPKNPAPKACEVGVVSLKTRSVPAAEAVAQSLAALQWLKAQGCRQFIFKICSTFDSTPEGNIGPVADALIEALGANAVPVCPAFPAAGRTVYQGHLFVGDKLLNESGLERHPLNPMTDPDLRRWLQRQSRNRVGHLRLDAVRTGAMGLRYALAALAQQGQALAIVDAIADNDLRVLGEACADTPLLVGGSGIALGLPRNFINRGLASGKVSPYKAVRGPEAILAGSCSQATLGQIRIHAKSHPTLGLDAAAVVPGHITAESVAKFIRSNEGKAPLVYSSAVPEKVAALQAAHGREAVSHAIERLFAETAKLLVASGVRRLVVAGGETSGAVVSALGLEALAIGPEIDPGVPALSNVDGAPLALALKSGNFGAPDFFAKALRLLGPAQ